MAARTTDYDAREAAESEQALLGALMLDSRVAWPAVKDLIGEQQLARADHRLIFRAIVEAMNAGGVADDVIVIDRLTELRQLEAAGGKEYIAQLVHDTPSAANVAAYARIVSNFSHRAKVVSIAGEIAARARLGPAAEALEHGQRALEQIDLGAATPPLHIEPASSWAAAAAPLPREWVLKDLIPAARVTSLFGTGGLGKTLLALQIGLHVSLGRPLFGVDVTGGSVLGIFCEDEQAELNRRVRAACAAERVDLADIDRLYVLSRDGLDSVLCTFEHDHIRLTAFYSQLEATVSALKPHLLILDTAADLFAGDFVSTPHVRQFLKIALGGLCVRHGCAVLLLAHPSAAAASSGEGGGFSTAWSNSVRSRLYLARPKPPDSDGDLSLDVQDRRVLEVKKANYAAGDVKLPLLYQSGSFVLDPEPVGGSVGPSAPRTKTARLALAALDYIRHKNPLVVGFRDLFTELQVGGVIPAGDYDELRKPLSRAVRQLLADGTIVETRTPRGYRLNPELR